MEGARRRRPMWQLLLLSSATITTIILEIFRLRRFWCTTGRSPTWIATGYTRASRPKWRSGELRCSRQRCCHRSDHAGPPRRSQGAVGGRAAQPSRRLKLAGIKSARLMLRLGTIITITSIDIRHQHRLTDDFRRDRDNRQPFLGGKAVLDQGPKRIESVPGADLFAFGDTPGVVADRNLVDPVAQAARLRGEFGTDFEPSRFQVHAANHRGPKCFVCRGFIADRSTEQEVRRKRQNSVGEQVLEGHPGGLSEESGAVYHVCLRSEEHTSELQSRQYLVCR